MTLLELYVELARLINQDVDGDMVVLVEDGNNYSSIESVTLNRNYVSLKAVGTHEEEE